jgi:hypothetical protein
MAYFYLQAQEFPEGLMKATGYLVPVQISTLIPHKFEPTRNCCVGWSNRESLFIIKTQGL